MDWGLSPTRQVATDNFKGDTNRPSSKLQLLSEAVRTNRRQTPSKLSSSWWPWRRRPIGTRGIEMVEAATTVLCGVVLVHACDRRRRARRKAGRPSWVSKVSRGSQESPTRTVAVSATEKHEYFEVLGVPLTPDFSAVGLAYFAQGALALAALAKPFYVKDTLGLSPADATVFLSLTYWPWIMKPLWGFIADSIPIFGSRRQAYLVLSGVVSVIGWLGLAGWWPVQATKEATLLFMMLGNLGIAFSDVVVDGLVVEKARDNPNLMGGLQSFSWACRGFGAILSAYFSGALLEMIGVQNVFALTAILPFFVIIASVLIEESKQETVKYSWDEAKETMGQVWEVVRSPAVFPSVAFILAWQATPTAGSAMFYFYTNELHFAPEFLGRSQLVGSLASLAGIVLYNRVFATVPLKDYLFRVQGIAVLLGFLPLLLVTRTNLALNIPDQAFVFGDDVIQTVAGELAHMPILVLAAQLCPPGIEATLFALLMSLLNLASFVSSNLGAFITHLLEVNESDFHNLSLLIFLCNVSGLLPLVLLPMLRDSKQRAPQA